MEILAKKILIDRYYHAASREKANNIVRDFIITKQLIVTGGLVIDYALRLKGEKIYEDFEVPDYDFFSPNNARDACELFMLLKDSGFENISLLPGIHPSTIKIFVFKDCVADITYISEDQFAEIQKSALTYNGILFRNPRIQYVDMHRSLSHPYENEPRETINFRWMKDFERFVMLYKYYPVDVKPANINISHKLNQKYVICGTYAVKYYLGVSGQVVGDHVYVMDEADFASFVAENGNKMKDIKKYKAYQELLPERTEFKFGEQHYTILHCRNKISVYYIDQQEQARENAIITAKLRVANAVVLPPGKITAVRIASINYCIIYCFSMFRITGEQSYNYYYGKLLDLVYKSYVGGDGRYYPSIVTYGVELEKPIIAFTTKNPEYKVQPVHIASDDSEEVRIEQLAKLPWDFKPIADLYDLDGKITN